MLNSDIRHDWKTWTPMSCIRGDQCWYDGRRFLTYCLLGPSPVLLLLAPSSLFSGKLLPLQPSHPLLVAYLRTSDDFSRFAARSPLHLHSGSRDFRSHDIYPMLWHRCKDHT